MFSELLSKRILVVEDDYMQSAELSLILELQGSDVVGPFPYLQDGLRAAENGNIDAAVLDVRLGDENVYQLADNLDMRKIPFIFVTGFSREKVPDRFIGVRCLQKPFDNNSMVMILAIAIAEHRSLH
ncbi:response regulator [Rhizobium cauense]|uniref:response regulator n=1 Tax=Rhizobium cauense TaxID=1166683 RepID=UPI001C6E0A7F|nr:response regulator [Rhizobium cauense]MBW9117659.1 response regulator [Rhizobium cauense]